MRALAAAIDRSPTTVAEGERGRRLRRSTLQALIEALPDASARGVLTGVHGRAPDAARLSDWYAEQVGAAAERVRLRCRRLGGSVHLRLEVAGLRLRDGAPLTPAGRERLARAIALPGIATSKTFLEWRGDALHQRVDEIVEDREAPWRLGATLSWLGRRGGALVGLVAPARELVIDLEGFEGLLEHEPTLLVTPAGTLPAADGDVSDGLGNLVADVVETRDGTWRLRVARPVPGLAHALVWGRLASETTERRDSRRRLIGQPWPHRLRIAREADGLSVAAVGRRARLGARTVAAAEGGADCGLRTLQQLLAALPALRPSDVLEDRRGDDPFVSHRELHGFECRRVSARARVGADRVDWSLDITSFHTLAGRHREVSAWGGAGPAVADCSAPTGARAGHEASRLRVSTMRDARGRRIAVMTVPRQLGMAGASWTRSFSVPRVPAPTGVEETGYTVLTPMRELRMTLEFDGVPCPSRACALAFPLFVQPWERDTPGLASRAELARDGTTWTAVFDSPIIGWSLQLRLDA